MAFADSFARDAQRLRDLYPRVNLSPMGTAVLANSSWPLNRQRLADLLGFDGLVVNSFDSGQVISFDVPLEAAGVMSSVAMRIGAMLQDIHTQYHQSRPWMLLDDSHTYTSSAMPQKLNPGVMKALRIDPKRSLEELNGDWTTSMELAETLQRLHQVPFRVGHHFATVVVNHAKAHSLLPNQFAYGDAVKLYTETAQKYQQSLTQLPLDETTFKATLSPEMMVRTRVGVGGPQPAEVKRMIAMAREMLTRDRAWLAERNNKLLAAEANLNTAFAMYLGNRSACAMRTMRYAPSGGQSVTQIGLFEPVSGRAMPMDIRGNIPVRTHQKPKFKCCSASQHISNETKRHD